METTVLSPEDFAAAIEEHHAEAGADMHRVIVGLQEQSKQAEIYARFAHLYTAQQVEVLDDARKAANGDEREQLERLWLEAADGLAAADIVQAAQDLTNDRLSYRVTWDGAEVSLNTLGALLNSEPDFERREAIYALVCVADEHFAPRDLDLAVKIQDLRREVFGLGGEVELASTRMGIDVEKFADDIEAVAKRTTDAYRERAARVFPELLGVDARHPSRAHAQHMRSLHLYDDIYTQERMLEVCSATLVDLGFDLDKIPTIKPDLEDRPQKNPRACVIPTRVPHEVNLVVRPTGGLTDYQAFLHEAGHALHFGLTSAELPVAYRALSRDHALTEIYSYVVERITHVPAWHMHHFGLDRETAEQVCAHTRFIDAMLFRRYAAKLRYELQFWSDPADPRNPDRYAMLLSQWTEMKYPTSQFVSDMDAGLYAADYLRAWRSSEHIIDTLETEHGEEWFRSPAAGAYLRDLFEQGTRPTNEELVSQAGGSANDFESLVSHLSS